MIDPFYLTMMLQAFLICLILTAIHGYLGFHVLARKVIFVDLAMAQIAALGTGFAIFLGFDPSHHGLTVYFYSLGFTILGAFFFAVTRMESERVPHEAIIGIIYATASALAILFLAKSPSSGARIKQMLTGDILSVGWPTIYKTTAIYGAIGVVHWFFREPFFKISLSPEEAREEGMPLRWWDFLFYVTFGVVITSSVAIAGVLLVFSFLVIPATLAILFVDSTRSRLLLGWGIGTIVSAAGILFSFQTNLPSGPSVVAAFAVTLGLGGILYYVQVSQRTGPALLRVLVGTLVLGSLMGGATYYGWARTGSGHTDARQDPLMKALQGDSLTQKIEVIDHLKNEPDPRYRSVLLRLLRHSESKRVRKHVVETLRAYDGSRIEPVLEEVGSSTSNLSLKLAIAEELVRRNNAGGLELLLAILQSDGPLMTRQNALRALQKVTGENFGYDVMGDHGEQKDALEEWFRLIEGMSSEDLRSVP